MKKLSLIILAAIFFAACHQNGNGTFEISGSIKHMKPQTVLYLDELPFDKANVVTLDSFVVKDTVKGEFHLRGMAIEEGLYRIRLSNDDAEVRIINDKKDIKVTFDLNNYLHPEISGSPATESLQKLFNECRKKDTLFLNAAMVLDTAKNIEQTKYAALQAEKEKAIKDKNALLSTFIKNSPSPSAVCYATQIASVTMAAEELAPVFAIAEKKFEAHKGIKLYMQALAARIAMEKKNEGEEYFLLNKQAPDLSMQDVNGKTIKISDFKGKYLLVDFWASWCGPCREENPIVVAAYEKFKNKNFEILGVSLDGDKEKWTDAIAKDKLVWTQMSDLKKWESAAVEAYKLEGIPFNVLLDPEGKIIASDLRGEKLEKTLETFLK